MPQPKPKYNLSYMLELLKITAADSFSALGIAPAGIHEQIDRAVEYVYAHLWGTNELKIAAEFYLCPLMVKKAIFNAAADALIAEGVGKFEPKEDGGLL